MSNLKKPEQAQGVVEEIDRYLVETNDYVGLLQRAREEIVRLSSFSSFQSGVAERSIERISALESRIDAQDELIAALRDIVDKFNRGGYGEAPCPFMANAEAALKQAVIEAARAARDVGIDTFDGKIKKALRALDKERG